MQNKIETATIIQSVMTAMETRGYKKSTLSKYRDMYSRLSRYCARVGANEYSEHIGQQFTEFVQHCNPSLSNVMLWHYKNAVRRLDCFLAGEKWKPLHRKGQGYAQSCYNSEICEYEDYLVRTGRTIIRIRKLVRRASEFLKMVEQLGCSQIESISANMILTGFEQATDKSGFRNAIGIFFQYAYNREMTKSNLRLLIPTVVQHHGVPSIYSPEEVEHLLASIERTTEIGKRDFAIILIAARLGLRASDIANLKFDDLKAENIKIVQLKTKQPLNLPLLREIKEAIFDYVDCGRPSSSDVHIFLNEGGYSAIESATVSARTRLAFMRSGIDCGIRKIGPHSLRASLATALLSEGNDYPTIQQVLGQLNIQSTKSYAKADIEQLRTHAIPIPLPSGNFAALLMGEVRAL